MKSPFPGMAPYLEGELWTTFYVQLAVEIARQLTPRLLPRYFAFANQRQVTDTPEEISIEATDVYPDVGVVEARPGPPPAGATVAEVPVKLRTVTPSLIPHSWVEIRDRRARRLVTLIEILICCAKGSACRWSSLFHWATTLCCSHERTGGLKPKSGRLL